MRETFQIHPIGRVCKKGRSASIEIEKKYQAALSGMAQFSHVYVLYWFHRNDSPEKRNTLQVHPCKNPRNPLTGVFATHSPLRPNLIALTLCRILSIDQNRIQIEDIDAEDGSPVIDLKCYIPGKEKTSAIRLPEWASHKAKA